MRGAADFDGFIMRSSKPLYAGLAQNTSREHFTHFTGRAALKSGGEGGDEVNGGGGVTAGAGKEGGLGAISSAGLAAGPSGIFPVNETTQPTQCSGGYGMTHAATVFKRAAIQSPMPAVLNAPIRAG